MTEPILVVHGVANHDPVAFKRTVMHLQQRVGDKYRLIEVFWGDLGGIGEGLRDTLPLLFPHADVTRSDESESEAFFELLQSQRDGLMGRQLTRAEPIDVVDAIYASTMIAGGTPPQSIDTRAGDDDLRKALAEAIPATTNIKSLRDPQMQKAVGELLAEYLRGSDSPDPMGVGSGGFQTRGWLDDTKQGIKGFIGKVDELIGKMTASLAGSANQWVRGALAEPISLSLGDIVAYHQRRLEIHERLFATLDKEAAGYGTAEKPITVMAHSLGGLVTLDALLGSDVMVDGRRRQLHIKHWLTFGSQQAFFHVIAPRIGLARYEPGRSVALPATVARWTNIWHPMDLLAFVAGSVFRLHDGGVPADVRLDTPASVMIDDKLWMHSAYWNSDLLIDSLK